MEILIIDAHPRPSFCSALADAYVKGAREKGKNVELVRLRDLSFDMNYRDPKGDDEQPLEPDLVEMQRKIRAAQCLTFVFPTWWGSYPALLKGFVDRVFLPGFAFKFYPDGLGWKRLLSGKRGRLIITMNGPVPFYQFFFRSAGVSAMKQATLEFCGVKPVEVSLLGSLAHSSEAQRRRMLADARRWGRCD